MRRESFGLCSVVLATSLAAWMTPASAAPASALALPGAGGLVPSIGGRATGALLPGATPVTWLGSPGAASGLRLQGGSSALDGLLDVAPKKALGGKKAKSKQRKQDVMPPALRAAYLAHEQASSPAAYNVAGTSAHHEKQRFQTHFDADEVRVLPDDEGRGGLGLKLARIGCGEDRREVAAGRREVSGNRVSYVRPELGLEEWYVHGRMGLEQGFTLAGAPCRDVGKLVVEVGVSGGVTPVKAGDGKGVEFWRGGVPTGVKYGELHVVDAAGRVLTSEMRVEGGRIVLGVDAGGAKWPVVVDPLVVVGEVKLGADDVMGGDSFGRQVSVDSSTALIGATGDDDRGIDSGAVYVFGRAGAGWAQEAKLTASDGGSGIRFGGAVSLSGNTALVGAASDGAGGVDAGSVYVFVRSGASWTQQAKIAASDGAAGDYFGESVSLSGNTALVGAFGDDDRGPSSGSAYVFVRSGVSWAQQAKLTASDGDAYEFFGRSVSVDGDTALVSRRSNPGAAYVFVRGGVSWTQQAKLTASDPSVSTFFGTSVSLSGNAALVGAPFDNTRGSAAGAAYVFARSGATWTQQAKITASDAANGDHFGADVSLSDQTALVGSAGSYVETDDQGSAYVFVRTGTSWTQQAKLTATDGAAGDQFGSGVALSGDTALVGASLDDDKGVDAGSAYVFGRTGVSWTKQAKVTASGSAAGDRLGQSVSLSGDTAVIGACQDDSRGDDSGAAYVFVRSGPGWKQQAKLTASDGDQFAQFGFDVSVSGDTALVGAYRDDERGFDSGAAYVFVRKGVLWAQQAKLTASDGGAEDHFGRDVSLAGEVALVGASGDDDKGAGSGAAYVFERIGLSWLPRAKLTAADGSADDKFGTSVSVEGNTALVGAILGNDKVDGSGSVYVFVRKGTLWEQQAKLAQPAATFGDQFGISVSLSGETALVGASSGNGEVGGSGSAHVFVRSGVSWLAQAKLTASDAESGDRFGYNVSLNGDTALAGASQDDHKGGGRSGSVYVFVRNGVSWKQQTKLTATDGAVGDRFGDSVAVDGRVALVGAPFGDSPLQDQGSAYAFHLQATIGSACEDSTLCATACVDNVCCDTPCTGGCAVCAKSLGATADGTCTPLPDNAPGDGTCGLFLCGGAEACPTACALDSDCAPTAYCSAANACVPRKPKGATCDLAAGKDCSQNNCNACDTGSCSDGVCCDTACVGACSVCSAALGAPTDGVCTTSPAGFPGTPACGGGVCNGQSPLCPSGCQGDKDCGPTFFCNASQACVPRKSQAQACDAAAGKDCLEANCRACQSDHCIDGFCCDTTCDGACDACSAKGSEGTCAVLVKNTKPQTTCDAQGLVLCDGASASCPGGCTIDSDCFNGFCQAGSCKPRKDLGGTCGAASQCQPAPGKTDAYCVDGVCCDAACDGKCQACAIGTKESGQDGGKCGAAKAGTNPASLCTVHDAQTPCGGVAACAADGTCAKEPTSTPCQAASCQGNLLQAQFCDGLGTCAKEDKTIDCAPYVCATNKCTNPCKSDDDCTDGNRCLVSNGVCAPRKAPGASCTMPNECASGFCADNVCCNAPCTGQCESCDATPGECLPTAAGQQPANDRAKCNATPDAECFGACDGGDTSTCKYPGATTLCAATTCNGDVFAPTVCNGAGTCKAQPTQDCAPFGCDATAAACKTTCSSSKDCATGAICGPNQQCTLGGSSCADAVTAKSPDGTLTSCAPYACLSGGCRATCAGDSDCDAAHRCQAQKCVSRTGSGGAGAGAGGSAGRSSGGAAGASAAAPAPAADDGGCGCRTVGTGPSSGGVAAVLGALVLATRRRRRGA